MDRPWAEPMNGHQLAVGLERIFDNLSKQIKTMQHFTFLQSVLFYIYMYQIYAIKDVNASNLNTINRTNR